MRFVCDQGRRNRSNGQCACPAGSAPLTDIGNTTSAIERTEDAIDASPLCGLREPVNEIETRLWETTASAIHQNRQESRGQNW
jgi:hypothetical protein